MRGILWRVIAAPSFAAFTAAATAPVQPGGALRLHPRPAPAAQPPSGASAQAQSRATRAGLTVAGAPAPLGPPPPRGTLLNISA